MPLYVYDLIILAILAFFAWRGAKKGLILTLFGLLTIVVAFLGARLVSTCFYQPVSNILEPAIYQAIVKVSPLPEQTDAAQAPTQPDGSEESAPQVNLSELLSLLEQEDLFQGFSAFLEQAVNNNTLGALTSASPTRLLADYLSKLIARTALFALSFLLIQVLLFLLGHTLDLAFHLPILSTVNMAGGLVLGLLKAVLLVFCLVWLCQLAGWIPAQPETPVLHLFTPDGVTQLLDRLVSGAGAMISPIG